MTLITTFINDQIEKQTLLMASVHENTYKQQHCLNVHLTRAPTGGGYPPLPFKFFINSGKTAARSAAKFCMTIYLSILRVVCKW